MAFILDGIAVSNHIKKQLSAYQGNCGSLSPGLAVVRFGSREDDISYQKSAEKRCKEFGVRFSLYEIEETIGQNEFIHLFDQINNDADVDGIILMGDYPDRGIKEYVQRKILPRKDVDGIGYENIARLYSNDKRAVIPCTAEAVLRLLDFYDIGLKGKKVCVLGRSLVIGKPVALSLLNRDATVTICHSKTADLKAQARGADIIVSSIGIARFIDLGFVTEDSILVDVGINFDENGKLCGDADYDLLFDHVKAITPVPKGIGSITNTVLISHVYHSFLERMNAG